MEKLNLAQKIIEIRKEVPYFKKNKSAFKGNYTQGSVILASIKQKMNELGLLLYPEVQNSEMIDKELTLKAVDKNGNSYDKLEKIRLFKGQGYWTWFDGQETIKIPWFFSAEQSDAAMAFGSALTYAERYFLTKFLNIPTDDLDPEEFAKQNDIVLKSAEALEKEQSLMDQFIIEIKELPNKSSFDEKSAGIVNSYAVRGLSNKWMRAQCQNIYKGLK